MVIIETVENGKLTTEMAVSTAQMALFLMGNNFSMGGHGGGKRSGRGQFQPYSRTVALDQTETTKDRNSRKLFSYKLYTYANIYSYRVTLYCMQEKHWTQSYSQ